MGLRGDRIRVRSGAIRRAFAHLGLSFLACVLLFGGCASVRFGSTFSEEGTASHTLEVTVPRASMNEQDIARVERQIADAEMNARSGGLTTARIDNPDSIGIRVINTTQDATDVGLALNSIFNTLVIDTNRGPVAPFQGTFERVSEAVGGTSFELNLTVDGDLLYAAAANVAPGHPQFSTPEGVREVVQIEYRVTMPGEITSTNGGRRGDGSAFWIIPLEGPTQLEARSTVGKDTPWIWTILVIVVALALVAATTAIVWKSMLHRRRAGRMRLPLTLRVKSDAAPAAAAGQVRPPDTLPEVRASLSRLIRRVLSGERLDTRHRRTPRRPVQLEEPHHGTDPKGD